MNNPSPTNSAIAAAAKAVCEQHGLPYAESHVAILIAQHVEPIVRAVEEDVHAAKVAAETFSASRREALAKLAEVSAERDALKKVAADHCEALTITHGIGYNSRNDEVRGLQAKLAAVEGERDAAWTALGECTCLMDPPDGGSPTLAELVGRMREAWKRAEAKLTEVEKSRARETNVTRDAMELMYAAEKRAQKYMHERDTTLTRAEQSEALLRETIANLYAWETNDDLRSRIEAHLAPKETT